MITLEVNGTKAEVDVPADTPLLWVLREELGLTGTKFGCGMALCGACTVHLDGQAVRACVLPVAEAAGRSIRTIEGLSGQGVPGASDPALHPVQQAWPLHPVQQAWIDENVPQCGYCQVGQIMSATALLAARPRPTDQDIDAAMSANLCRCGTYQRIRKAIHRAADLMSGGEETLAARGGKP
jgi:isoquinoline 1-oxidoreductase subunit alpha